ncbi:MAG: hypothetical protein AAF587_33085 [Bacteroidota bacterium]
MPRRRRKYRPPQQEPEKPTPFFTKTKREEGEYARQAANSPSSLQTKDCIQEAHLFALQKLQAVSCILHQSQPDLALLNQSKALELANQLLASDIWQISVLQQAIDNILQQLKNAQFICTGRIHHAFGGKKQCIRLGDEVHTLSLKQQVREILSATIKATTLPELHGPPIRTTDQTDPSANWLLYICRLLDLLPEQPFLITGTPENPFPPKPAPELSPDAPEPEPDTQEAFSIHGEGEETEEQEEEESTSSETSSRGILGRLINRFTSNT